MADKDYVQETISRAQVVLSVLDAVAEGSGEVAEGLALGAEDGTMKPPEKEQRVQSRNSGMRSANCANS